MALGDAPALQGSDQGLAGAGPAANQARPASAQDAESAAWQPGSDADCQDLNEVLPLAALGAGLELTGHDQGPTTELWQASDPLPLSDAARQLLAGARERSAVLHQAGYLDLFGAVWGCTLQDAQGEVYIVTLQDISDAEMDGGQQQVTLVKALRLIGPEADQ